MARQLETAAHFNPMPQLSLFNEPATTGKFQPGKPEPVSPLKLARKTDPESSKEAARKLVYSGELKTHEETIYYLLLRAEKMGRADSTCYELEKDMQVVAESLRFDRHEIIKRLSSLGNKGAAEKTGIRWCEVGKKNLQAWKAV